LGRLRFVTRSYSQDSPKLVADVGGTRTLLRETGNGDGMNLEEVARDLKNAREVLGGVEAERT
jgi:hypothetical protein